MIDLSIIVPVYNVEDYLQNCIESILNQTFKNFELILVNDGSKDKSLSIIQKYSTLDERIIVINQKNQGVSIARNNAIKIAKGKYIGFVDPDDTIEPNMYEQMINSAQYNKSDIVIIGYNRIEGTDITQYMLTGTDIVLNNKQLTSSFFKSSKLIGWTIWNKIFNKDILDSIEFNPKLKNGEDTLFFFECCKNANIASVVKSIGYNYYIRNNSATTMRKNLNNNDIFVFEEILNSSKELGYDILNCAEEHILDFALTMYNKYDHSTKILIKNFFKKYIFNNFIHFAINKNISLKLKMMYIFIAANMHK